MTEGFDGYTIGQAAGILSSLCGAPVYTQTADLSLEDRGREDLADLGGIVRLSLHPFRDLEGRRAGGGALSDDGYFDVPVAWAYLEPGMTYIAGRLRVSCLYVYDWGGVPFESVRQATSFLTAHSRSEACEVMEA